MTPLELLYDESLNGDHVCAWSKLDDLQRDEPFVEATAGQLAGVLACEAGAVERRTKALEAAGWLRVERRRGNNLPNRYVVLGSLRPKAPAVIAAAAPQPPAAPERPAQPAWCGHCDAVGRWREDADGRVSRCWCATSATPPF